MIFDHMQPEDLPFVFLAFAILVIVIHVALNRIFPKK